MADLRRRQAEGELAAASTPGSCCWRMAAVAAGITLPGMAARVTGLDPQTPDFVERYGKQLRLLVRRLAQPQPN